MKENAAVGYVCMALLALQFGLQPIVTQTFLRPSTDMTTVVLLGELLKAAIAFALVVTAGGCKEVSNLFRGWSFRKSLAAVGLPAMTFPVQNILVMVGVRHSPPTLFSILNQTKLVSAAVFVYFIVGRKQSPLQVLALAMIFSASVILTYRAGDGGDEAAPSAAGDGEITFVVQWYPHQASMLLGIVPILSAAMLSGLGGALCQRATQQNAADPDNIYRGRPNLFSMELSVYSAINLLLGTLGKSLWFGEAGGDASTAAAAAATTSVDLPSLVPIFTNAIGGLLVAQVTFHAGPVKKGFAIVFGILVTAATQSAIVGAPLPGGFWIALPVVVAALLLYSAPFAQPSKSKPPPPSPAATAGGKKDE